MSALPIPTLAMIADLEAKIHAEARPRYATEFARLRKACALGVPVSDLPEVKRELRRAMQTRQNKGGRPRQTTGKQAIPKPVDPNGWEATIADLTAHPIPLPEDGE